MPQKCFSALRFYQSLTPEFGETIMLATRLTRQRKQSFFLAQTNLLQCEKSSAMMNLSRNSLSASACWVGFIEPPVLRKTAGPKAQYSGNNHQCIALLFRANA